MPRNCYHDHPVRFIGWRTVPRQQGASEDPTINWGKMQSPDFCAYPTCGVLLIHCLDLSPSHHHKRGSENCSTGKPFGVCGWAGKRLCGSPSARIARVKKKRDGKLGSECGETEWKEAASVVRKAAALPPHMQSAESKIRTVFGESTGKETQRLTYCRGWCVEGQGGLISACSLRATKMVPLWGQGLLEGSSFSHHFSITMVAATLRLFLLPSAG